ncbi:MAG: DUF2079 domain-containing protein [Halobacteriovoraceae bacterium]|nr:DUF2079 domain-containing protein [Halobacteriovoraceae bacterium]
MTEESILKKTKYAFIGIGIVLSLFILVGNVKRSLNFGLPTYDYGIYQQAVFEMAHQKKLNPFMSVRDEYVWNDHFMPILITAIPGAWITDYANWFLTSYEWLWYILFLFLMVYLSRDLPIEDQLGALVGALFCKAWLVAMHFSAHPGPWSGALWALVVYSIVKRNHSLIFWTTISLILYRESYVFCIFTLGVFYTLKEDRKLGLKLLAFSLLYMFFLFFLRERLIGPTYNYAARLMKPFMDDPVAGAILHLKEFKYKMVFKLIMPYLIPTFFWIRELKRENILNHPYIAVLFLMAPYYAMHFLANKFNYQYGVAAVVPFLALTTFNGTFKKIREKNIYLFIVTLLIFLLNGTSYHKRFIKFALEKYDNGSRISREFNLEIEKVKNIVLETDKDLKIISTSYLAARFIQPGMTNVHTIEEFMNFRDHFDILLYPKHKKYIYDSRNISKHDYMMENCKSMIEEIIYDSKLFFMAKGNFTRECYLKNHY